MSNYLFTGETKVVNGVTLRRIQAKADFISGDGIAIETGEKGGWIEKEENLTDNAWVSGNAYVFGNAWVSGNARVFGNSQVFGNARVFGNSQVSDNARVFGDARVSGNARMFDYAWISSTTCYFVIGPIGSRNDHTTFCKNVFGEIIVICGCFSGTLSDFRKKVRETHGDGKHAKAYLLAADLAEIQIWRSQDDSL